jgi:predicted nucleic acid-binding protein
MAAGETLLLPAHAIAEAFSVLTRLPADKRLTPAEAWRLLETNFVSEGRVVALDATVYPALFARAASAGIAGGRVYDLIIAETASRAAASALVTLNPKHFPSPPPGLRIVDPTARPDSGWNDHS